MNKRIKIYRAFLGLVFVLCCILTCFYMANNNYVENENREININKISSVNAEGTLVMPLGISIGVYLETNGVLVAGTSFITGSDGINYEPALNKIYEGDYITKINGIDINSKSQLLFLINKYGDKDITVGIRRNGEEFQVLVTPVKVKGGEYKIGVWARDDTQGIGTLTYMTMDGSFGALGHGINDVDTKKLLNSNNGLLYKANIWGITKGVDGKPGGLCGTIDYEKCNEIGTILKNTNKGIFGKLNEEGLQYIEENFNSDYCQTAVKSEVHRGKAYILSYISGSLKQYEIKICDLDRNRADNKGIVLEVVDKELLKLTNGIVQGMSGSPIIQDGKLIGAVTHVFVNNPTKGYGIFVESMLEK